MIDKKGLGERLKKVRANENIRSARAMAKILKIDHSYYTKSEKGEGLGEDSLKFIIDTWGYNRNWLLFGDKGVPKGQSNPQKNVGNNTHKTGELSKIDEKQLTLETVRDLAKSSVQQTEIVADLVSNNTKLIDYIVTKEPNSNSNQKSPIHISDILTPYLMKMAKAAFEEKAFGSVEEGIVKLGKWMSADVMANAG